MDPLVFKCNSGVSSPIGSPGGAKANGTTIVKERKIATWNVRGLLKVGKLQIVEREARRYGVEILGMAETHWQGSGHFRTTGGNTVYYSGGQESRNGVAIMTQGKWSEAVAEYKPVSDRVLVVIFNTRPIKLNIIQIYAPTAEATDEEREEFYRVLTTELERLPKGNLTIVQGDFNAKVGKEEVPSVAGKYGLGNRNENGDRLVEFCQEYKMVIANTHFKHHPRRLYTWISPGDRCRNQIDYSLIASRWKSSIRNIKTVPGADCGSDHQMLYFRLRLKLAVQTKREPRPPRIETAKELSVLRKEIRSRLEKVPGSTEEKWINLKSSINEAAMDVIRSRKKTPRNKGWLSDETISLVEKRRDLKAKGMQTGEEYRRTSAMIQRSCRQDKNRHIENICREIETQSRSGEPKEMFRTIRRITRSFKAQTGVIEDENGEILTNREQIGDRWKRYCQCLYGDDDGKMEPIKLPEEREPPILREEIVKAIQKLRNGRAPGADMVTGEMLKVTGEIGIDILHDICRDIWNSGTWPSDWTSSVYIPIHKKGKTENCCNYRTITLTSHASKVLLNVIHERIRHFLNEQIPLEQAGFVKGRGTREQILNVRQLIEKCREFNTPLILCFVDYNKAFDCVKWKNLWVILAEMGVPEHLITLIRNLYANGRAVVRLQEGESDPFDPAKGVRQGCILSPILFNIYGEYIMRCALEGWNDGVRIGGRTINNLRFADDTTLCAQTMPEMENLLKRVEEESQKLGLTINKGKTKIMIVDRGKLLPDTAAPSGYEQVSQFIYLGSMVDSEGGSTKEIKRRIALARDATVRLTTIWKDRAITQGTKLKLLKTLVFPVFLYAAETWTIKMADRKRIDAFEMWAYRRMLRISWTEKKTNVSILNALKVETRLSTICFQRIMQFFGHIVRRQGENLEKLIVQGKVEGKRKRGRSPSRWIDQVEECAGQSLGAVIRIAEDRDAWRNIAAKDGSPNLQT